MPDRNRLRYVAYLIGGIAVLGALAFGGTEIHRRQLENAEAYKQAVREAESAKRQTAQEIAAECAVPGAATDFIRECLADKVKAHGEQYTTSKDLEAQVNMAFWAKWMVYVGAVGIPISILGLFGLLLSLRQTRQAISTDREIGEAQVRAYLTIESVLVSASVKEEGIWWHLDVRVYNCGQSPARKVNARAVSTTDMVLEHKGYSMVTGLKPNGTGEMHVSLFTTNSDLRFVDDKKKSIILMLKLSVSYTDVFKIIVTDQYICTGIINAENGAKAEMGAVDSPLSN